MSSFSRLLMSAASAVALASPVAALAQAAAPAPPPPAAAAPAPVTAASPELAPRGNMFATLQASTHFTILIKALNAANLSSVLQTTPDITLFAPTDDAFQALPAAQLAALLKNPQVLQQILAYHLVHLNLDSVKFKGAKGPVESVEKGKLQIDGSGAVIKVNDANIIQADVHATNGVIQVVDKVLIPTDVTLPTATAAADSANPAAR